MSDGTRIDRELRTIPCIGYSDCLLPQAERLDAGAICRKGRCSLSFISQVEANNGEKLRGISLTMLFRMADVLKAPVSKFFEDESAA